MHRSMIIFLSLLAVKIVLFIAVVWISILKKRIQTKYSQIQEDFRYVEMQNENLTKQLEETLKVQQENKELSIQVAVKEQSIEQLRQSIKEQKEYIDNTSKQMKLEFENISKNLLEEQRSKFKEQSDESIISVTKPLRENLSEFAKKVDDYYKQEHTDKELLKSTIERYSQTAEKLSNAFTKDKKLQGNWGERHLEMVLNASGLKKGREYEMQVQVKGSSNQFIDALIKLPDDKHLIIDSKTSFVNYYNLKNALTDEEREKFKKAFLNDVKNQIQDLGSKGYHQSLKGDRSLFSPEFVFMFMPMEDAFILALNEDPSLYTLAFKQKIALCSPTTLFGFARTVASLWTLAIQNKNTFDIKEEAQKMCKKMEGFIEELEKILSYLQKSQEAVESARTKLNGRGGVLSIGSKLNKLGIKNNLKDYIKEEDVMEAIEQDKDTAQVASEKKETLWEG